MDFMQTKKNIAIYTDRFGELESEQGIQEYLFVQANNFRGDTKVGLKSNTTKSEEILADFWEKHENLSKIN